VAGGRVAGRSEQTAWPAAAAAAAAAAVAAVAAVAAGGPQAGPSSGLN